MHHNVHILKYSKLSSYVCEKTVLQAVTLYFPNSRKKYTNLEDVNLIDYISQHERYKHVRTQDLWKLMEKKKVLPGKGTTDRHVHESNISSMKTGGQGYVVNVAIHYRLDSPRIISCWGHLCPCSRCVGRNSE